MHDHEHGPAALCLGNKEYEESSKSATTHLMPQGGVVEVDAGDVWSFKRSLAAWPNVGGLYARKRKEAVAAAAAAAAPGAAPAAPAAAAAAAAEL